MQQGSAILPIEASAMRMLTNREHSRWELRRKLNARFDECELIEQVLQDLESRDWLSDARFTEHYVHVRTNRGYGPLKISAELRERGIDIELVNKWIEVSGSEWRQHISKVAQRKYGDAPAENQKDQARRARFLTHRGFPSNLIRRYLWD